jgi:SagB-type dehydrogenase family enzyme
LSKPPAQARATRNLVSLDYHETTKHHFSRFARSRGYLDWATQPDPFRRYPGARLIPLPHEDAGRTSSLREAGRVPARPDMASVAWFLRYAMGLSAWKAYKETRWALRVNPSSGNLHPTEAYVVQDGHVFHYAAREHAFEERAVLPYAVWDAYLGGGPGFLVALTSIQWREAWKYGERAFRYCQHDVGHAIAALRISASLFGWSLRLLPEWSDDQLATLLGVNRDEDRGDAEREEPECVALVSASMAWSPGEPEVLVAAARTATWHGRANVLSPHHDEWPIIEQVTRATKYGGRDSQLPPLDDARGGLSDTRRPTSNSQSAAVSQPSYSPGVILQRRSALAFDARTTLPRERFLSMLDRLNPSLAPFDAIDWPPHVHLALFVHRVEGVVPGLYAYFRADDVRDEWRSAMRPEFLWEEAAAGLFLLVPTDVTWAANRVSCDQSIASDGFFSLGMIARLDSAVKTRGEWFYRRLFWECGLIGQVLYLEAEAAGGRATGIGCFYDDPVHEILGLTGREWQSLYHFSMGMPVDDARLTSEPGYAWEVVAL